MVESQLRNMLLVALLLAGVIAPASITAQGLRDMLKKTTESLFTDEDDIGLGLKQALEFGVDEAVKQLSAENGYLESPYKILIPEEARVVVDKVKYVPGLQNVEKDLINKMNEAAEYAARKATPIFVSAITSMTFDDAMKILSGEKDAATRYLERSTRDQLYAEFMPVIQKALDEVGAREIWATATESYNKLPFVKKVNPNLDDHVNNKALDGLFGEIEKKEAGIRSDQSQRTTELLQRVFGQQD